MKYIYGDTEIDTTKVSDEELAEECRKAKKWQDEQNGKELFEESIDYLIERSR